MAGHFSAEPGVDPSETGPSAELRRLAADLAADPDWIPAVSREIAELVQREFPRLRDDVELRATTYAGSDSNVRQIIEVLRVGADPAEAGAPPTAIEHAYEYVRRGVPVDVLLRAYQVGQAAFIHALSRAARDAIDDPDEVVEALEEVSAITLAYINSVIGELLKRYGQERDRWVRSAAAVRAETVRSLLAGESANVESAEQRLGYPLRRSHLAFVVWSPAESGNVDETGVLERSASSFAEGLGAASCLLVPLGPHLIAGWLGGHRERRSGRPARISTEIAPGARAALGEPGSGVDGFARSHREAMQARRVAELAGRRPGSVVAYADVALTALASADLDHARDFVLRELGPLADDDDEVLRLSGTLRVYLEERSSPRRTAERLGVHPNTVANRIRAAQELLGQPIESRVSELLVALRLAAVVRGNSRGVGAQAG